MSQLSWEIGTILKNKKSGDLCKFYGVRGKFIAIQPLLSSWTEFSNHQSYEPTTLTEEEAKLIELL